MKAFLNYFIFLLSVCISNPCKNGGTCFVNPQIPHVAKCNCPPKFTGDKCQTYIKATYCDEYPSYHCVSERFCFKPFSTDIKSTDVGPRSVIIDITDLQG